jgi:hypothetical protein
MWEVTGGVKCRKVIKWCGVSHSLFCLFSCFLLLNQLSLSYVIGTVRVDSQFLFFLFSLSLSQFYYLFGTVRRKLHISFVQSLFMLVGKWILEQHWKLYMYIIVALVLFSNTLFSHLSLSSYVTGSVYINSGVLQGGFESYPEIYPGKFLLVYSSLAVPTGLYSLFISVITSCPLY